MLFAAPARPYRPHCPCRARRSAALPPANSAAPPRTSPTPASGNPSPADPLSPVETDVLGPGWMTCGVAPGVVAWAGVGAPGAGVADGEPGVAPGVRSPPGPVTTDGRVCCGVGSVTCVGCVGPFVPSPLSAAPEAPAFGLCCAAWAVAVLGANCADPA